MQQQDDIHVPFIVASLLFGVFGGFTLAVTLPVQAALGGFNVGWVSHAQVHGHLQVVGFAGLFVCGMAMKLAPRFAQRTKVAASGLVMPGFWLLVAGLLLRAVGQPLADHEGFDVTLGAGVLSELAGATCIAVAIFATLRGSLRKADPASLLLAGGMCWFVAQGVLGAWWLIGLAADGGTILVTRHDAALVNMQFFGLLLGALLGVGIRSFPTFFGMPPTPRWAGLATFTLINAGLVAWTASAAWAAPERLGAAGRLAIGAGIVVAVASFGLARRKHRLAAASAGYVWALQPVLAWLALTGLLLAWSGGRAVLSGDRAPLEEVDAIRHVFAVGVVTLAIVGMAQLILPEFASERLVAHPSKWRGPAFGAALSLAALLRGVLPFLGAGAGIEGDVRWWAMGAGGTLAFLAAAAFAVFFWRARRSHTAYRRRIEAMKQQKAAAALKMADG